MSRLRKLLRPALTFLAATMVTAALGSIAQTQLNLQALIDMGMTIELPLRLRSSLADLANFAPLWSVIVGVAFALAFPVASLLQRWFPRSRSLAFPLAGVMAVAVTLVLMDYALGITVIAAARSTLGVVLLCVSGAVGGWVQARFGKSSEATAA